MALRDWIPRVSDAARSTAGRVTGLASSARRSARARIERFGERGADPTSRLIPDEPSIPVPADLSESGSAPDLFPVAAEAVPRDAVEDRPRLIPRRMRDPEYRRTQYAQIYDSHIEPINRLVDRLREESGAWVPHVAPIYGGTGARVLAVFRDPGPTTQQDSGSGMLSLENDDPSAERHLGLVENSGLAATDLISWNAYPWYINRTPTGVEIDRGAEAMQRLIELLPELVVVVVHGKDAQTAWRRFVRSGRSAGRQLDVVTTYHTSRQAFRTSDPDERARREKKLVDDYARVAALLADAPR